MWVCPNCRAEVDDGFEVCWSCGSLASGVPDATFRKETEGIITEEAFHQEESERLHESLVRVAAFQKETDAHLLRNELEREGIRAVVADELAGGWNLFLGPALPGVTVQVSERDAERAREVFDRVQETQAARGEDPDENEDETED